MPRPTAFFHDERTLWHGGGQYVPTIPAGGLLRPAADDLCGGRLVLAHEGGYSELHVPFRGHATIATLAGSPIEAPDPLRDTIRARQPQARWINHVPDWLRQPAGARGL